VVTRWLAIAVLAAAQAAVAHAQGFPDRPVKIIVPLTQGGSPDTIARTIAAALQPAWGQPVVVENRPGGNQNIGAELVAKSAADGYTWLLTPENVLTVNPHLGNTPFDPFADFTLVMQVARIQFLLVVHPSVPASSVQELVALARAKPGTLDFGSSGNGSPQHLGGAMMQALAGIKMNHVPYKGATQAIQDLLPGRIQVWIGAANTLLPHIKDGKLRLLAVAGSERYPTLPDVPTIAEAGVPGFALNTWLGVIMAARTPPEIVAKVNADVTRILQTPELKARFAAIGIDVTTTSPQAFAELVREDYARWGKIIREAGIRAE
jgi:tripartite-type tricarboxylate transporter receptor subunit TctC